MSRLRGARSVTSRSPIQISPEVTSSSPASIRRSVDLPQPDGPTRTKNSPSWMSRETPSTAVTAPKDFVTSASRISAIPTDGIDQLRRRQDHSPRTGIDQPQDHFYAGAMKLGVEAALVDGLLVKG